MQQTQPGQSNQAGQTRLVIRPHLPLMPDQRWGIVGKTGSGKSVFAKWMLSRWRKAGWRILIIDQYGRWNTAGTYADKPQAATLESPFILKSPRLLDDCPAMLYKPSLPVYRDDGLNILLFECVKEGGVVVDFNEGKGVSTSGYIPPGVSEVFVAGRKAQIPTLLETQTPRHVHTDILSQCEWKVCFRLNHPDQREYMAAYMCDVRIADPIKTPYAFWLHNENWDMAEFMAPLPESEVKQWVK